MQSDFYQLYRQDTHSSFLKCFIFSFFNLFFRLEETAKAIALYNRWIVQKGLSQSSSKLLEFLNIKIKVVGLGKLDSQTGYLIFGNHPSMIDLLIFLSALKTDKVKLLGNQNLLKLIPSLSKYIFPIQNLQITKEKSFNNLIGKFLMSSFPSIVNFSPKQKVFDYNQKSVDKAADFLAKGGKLIVAPYGQRYLPQKKYFKKGIGFVLAKARQQPKASPIKFLPFFVEFSHYRIFDLWILFRFRREINLTIYFLAPMNSSLFEKLIKDPKKLALKIDEKYRKLVKNEDFQKT